MAGARRRDRRGPARPDLSGSSLRALDGRQGLLLRPLPRAARRRPAGAPRLPEALLPRSARRRPPTRSSTSARTSGVGYRRRVSPTTAATSSCRSGTTGPTTRPALLQGPARAERPGRRADRRLRRPVHVRRQRRPGLLVQTDLDAPRGRVIAIDLGSARAEQLAGGDLPKPPRRLDSVHLVGDRSRRLPEGRPRAGHASSTTAGSLRARGRAARPRVRSAASAASATTTRRSTPSPASPRRPRSTATTCATRREHGLPAARRWTSTPTTTRRSRSSTRARTAPASRCSSRHKKGLKLDGTNPTYLYGYGGFNISLHARASPRRRSCGWRWAASTRCANLRGGGEYGEEWHQAGTKLQKQNVFDDFIAAAEWLIANSYTSPPKLAIGGGSQRRPAGRRGA